MKMHMSTRKIKQSWWVDFRFNDFRYRKKSPDNSKSGAAVYESILRQNLSRGEPIDGKIDNCNFPTYREFAEKWFSTYVRNNNKPSEQKSKSVILISHLIPAFGHLRIDNITSLMVEEYKNKKLKYGLSPKTINNHLVVLSKSLKTAQEWVGLVSLPRVKFLKVPPQSFNFLTSIESGKLLDGIKDNMWRAMVLLAVRTGLRLGELVALQWEDIDMKNRLITVRRSAVRGVVSSPKSNKHRYIPFSDEVHEALLSLNNKKGLVFNLNNCLMNHETPRLNLIRICEKAGVKKIGWHNLRHTFASQLVAAGASLKAVQELLGHSDIRTTMRYSHLAPSTLIDTVKLLDTIKTVKIENFGQQVGNVASSIFSLDQKTPVNTGVSVDDFGSRGGNRTHDLRLMSPSL